MSGNGNGNAVATLSDDLVARAKAIASRSDELLHLLEDARQRLVDLDEKPARRQPRRKAAEPPREPAKASKNGSKNGKVSEGLRLITGQMAASGIKREEIAERLREEFGVTDPEPILKEVGL